jgi:hypothetical protein
MPEDQDIEGTVKALIRRISMLARNPLESAPTLIREQRGRELGEASVLLLETLPPTLRLMALRGQFPRILNQIAEAWQSPESFAALIDSLLIDQRGQRQGFPFEVVTELTELREYYFSMVHPEARRFAGASWVRGFR